MAVGGQGCLRRFPWDPFPVKAQMLRQEVDWGDVPSLLPPQQPLELSLKSC